MPRPSPALLMLVSAAAAWPGARAQTAPPPVVLRPGEIAKGELTADDAPFRSPRVPTAPGATARHDAFRLDGCEAGAVTIEVRSPDFDAFAQVVGDDGRVLAEDDSGAGAGDARIVLAGAVANGKTLYVIGKRAQLGEYEVEVRRGSPPQPAPPAEHARAVERATAALLRQEQRHGVESAQVAERCLVLARALMHAERPDEALPHAERALRVRERLELTDEEIAECWRELGLVHTARKHPEQALEAYAQCRDLLEQLHGTAHRALPSLLLDTGLAQLANGNRPAAIAALREGIERFDQQHNPDLAVRGTLAVRLADALEGAADWDGAVACLRDAVPALTRDHAASLVVANLQLVLAARLLDFVDIGAARTLHERAAAVLRANLPPEHVRVIESLWLGAVIANAESRRADLRAAVADLRSALARPGAARPWGPDGTANALAELELLTNEPQNAVALLRDRLPSLEQTAPGSTLHVRTLANLALALARSGQTAEAAALVRRALDDPAVQAAERSARNRLLTAGGELLAPTDPTRARDCLRELLDGAGPTPSVARVTFLDSLARCHVLCGEPRLAIATSLQASACGLQVLGHQLPCLTDPESLQLYASVRPTLDLLVALLRQFRDADPEPVFAQVIEWQARVLRGEVGDRRRAREQLGDEALRLLERWRAIERELGTPASQDAAAASRSAAARSRLAAERDAIERQLVQPTGGAAVPAIAVAALRERLAADEAFVEYVTFLPRAGDPADWHRPHAVAFVLRRDGPVRLAWLGALAPIESTLATTLTLVGRRHAPDAKGLALETRALQQLTAQVWTPLLPLLEGAQRVVIATDGVFATVPFAALLARDERRYLVEERELQLVTGAADLLATPKATRTPSVLLLGDVDFGAGTAFASLPGSATELADLADLARRHLPADTPLALLRGADATAAALTTAAPSRTWVHLATHGLFDGSAAASAPLPAVVDAARLAAERAVQQIAAASAAGVALAGANAGEAGIVRCAALSWLDLRDCELAVLSACETGRGHAFTGEQVLGLRRALRLAGAARTMTTLWRVGDEHAVALTALCYRELWQHGASPHAALRTAQLEALARCRREHDGDGLPSRWAGYVVEGPR